MASMTSILGRKFLAGGIAFVVATGLAGTALLTGMTSGAQASSDTTTTSTSTKTVDPDVAKFRADLKAARALTGEARTEAIKKVRTDAKAGKYGDKVEKRIDRRRERAGAIWKNAPKELRADLKAARAAAPADRPAKVHEVFAKALAGDYGDRAQKRAEKLKRVVDGK